MRSRIIYCSISKQFKRENLTIKEYSMYLSHNITVNQTNYGTLNMNYEHEVGDVVAQWLVRRTWDLKFEPCPVHTVVYLTICTVGDVLAQWLVRRTWDLKDESSSPGRCTHVVFFGKTLNSHNASLHPGV